MLNAFEGRTPTIGKNAYVHPSADIIGAVVIGSGCWIGPGARLRGDYGHIIIGDNTAIEDNCVIHARPDGETRIGRWVTVGHTAIVHNATVHDWAVIGMGSIVSDWAEVGEWAVIGEGSLVKRHQRVEEGAIAVGQPVRILEKRVDATYRSEWTVFKKTYVDLAWRYHAGLT